MNYRVGASDFRLQTPSESPESRWSLGDLDPSVIVCDDRDDMIHC